MKELLLAAALLLSYNAFSQTILQPGDIVFKAFDNNISADNGDQVDKISILNLKAIKPGTEFHILKGSYEFAINQWFNYAMDGPVDHVQKIRYTGTFDIPLNSNICFYVPSDDQGNLLINNFTINGEASLDFVVENDGASNSSNLNMDDEANSIFITQGAWWHYSDHSTLFGRGVACFNYGTTWTDSGNSIPLGSSNIPEELNCLAVQGPVTSDFFVSYFECSNPFGQEIDFIRSQAVDFSNWQTTIGGSDVDLPSNICETNCSLTLPLTINIKVYLEGALINFDNGNSNYLNEMRVDLNQLQVLPGQTYNDGLFGSQYFPPGQPYSSSPWFYTGNEGEGFDSNGDVANGDANYPANAVDWVFVTLRTVATEPNSTVCEAAGILLKNGTVFFPEPIDCYEQDASGFYYITVEHSSHLIIMTANAIEAQGGVLNHDFTINQSYKDLFGIGVGQKTIVLESGIERFAMYAGNSDQNLSNKSSTDINVNDKIVWEFWNNTFPAYHPADHDLSSDINANDKILWETNNNQFSSVPR